MGVAAWRSQAKKLSWSGQRNSGNKLATRTGENSGGLITQEGRCPLLVRCCRRNAAKSLSNKLGTSFAQGMAVMPKGPRGEKRPADVIGAAVRVMRIATGEETEELPDSAKSAAA